VEGDTMSFADEFDERGREARVDEAALSRVLQAEDLHEERLRRCEAWAQHSARQLNLLQTHYDALTARYQASVETLQAALETLHQRVAALEAASTLTSSRGQTGPSPSIRVVPNGA
jgi:hypothetical protein